MKHKFISFEDRQVIEDCLKHKMTYIEIAASLDNRFSPSGIKQEVLRCGGAQHYTALKAHARRIAATESRVKKLTKQFTETEKAKIRQYLEEGYTVIFISELLRAAESRVREFMKRENLKPAKRQRTMVDRIIEMEKKIELLFDLLQEKT